MKGGKTEALSIPELDALAETYRPRNVLWTKAEDEILRRYFSRVPLEALVKYLPGRTAVAIKDRGMRIVRGP